jgi:hypothetical protein
VTNTKIEIDGQRTVYTFNYLRLAARHLIGQTGELNAALYGETAEAMMSIVASAFYLEAALNHIGSMVLPFWDSVERKLDPEAKLRVLAHELKLTPDFGIRPFQTARRLFRVRNELAHGKTSEVKIRVEFDQLNGFIGATDVKPHWDSLLSREEATLFFEDASRVVETFFGAAPEARVGDLLTDVERPDGAMSPA